MPKKKQDYFKGLRKASKGIAGLGISTGLTAGIIGQAPPGAYLGGLTTGLNTLSNFVPIGVTAIGGQSVLKELKNMRRK